MASETVLFEIAPISRYKHGQARVTATFRMHNAGTQYESMTVQFPLAWGDENGYIVPCEQSDYFGYPSITDLAAWVNDVEVPTTTEMTLVTVVSSNYPDIQLNIPCWSDFPVTFPAGKDTTIRVTYTALGYGAVSDGSWSLVSGDSPAAWTEFHYILVTGAAWNGPIGSADVIFRLPYEVTSESLYGATPEGLASNHMSITGKDVIWHNENFKPDENVWIELINPSVWISLLESNKAIQTNPNDSEAWGQLGKAYKEAAWGRRGFIDDHFYQESDAAYKKAVSLAPNDADWHFGYAELLCWKALWSDAHDMTNCLNQLNATLKLRPNYPKALEALNGMAFLNINTPGTIPENLIQTAQAVPTPTVGDTPTLTLFGTLIPTDTLEPTETFVPISTRPLNLSGTPQHFPLETPSFTSTVISASSTPGSTQARASSSIGSSTPFPLTGSPTSHPSDETNNKHASIPYVAIGLALLIALGIGLAASRRFR